MNSTYTKHRKSWVQSLTVGSWVVLPNGKVERIDHVSDRKVWVGDLGFSRRTGDGLTEPTSEQKVPAIRQEAINHIRGAVLEQFPTHILQSLAEIVLYIEKRQAPGF